MRGKRVDKKGAEKEGEGREGGTCVRDVPVRGFLVLRGHRRSNLPRTPTRRV